MLCNPKAKSLSFGALLIPSASTYAPTLVISDHLGFSETHVDLVVFMIVFVIVAIIFKLFPALLLPIICLSASCIASLNQHIEHSHTS